MEIDEYYGNSVSYHLISTEDWEKISKAKGSACESNYDYFLRQMRTLDEGYPYVGGFPSQSSQNQAQKDLFEGRTSMMERVINNINACFAKIEEEKKGEILKQRQEQVSTALQECNFDFFEEMTNQEKMDTFGERKACEEDKNEPESKPVQITPISAPVPEPVAAPTYVPTTPVESAPVKKEPVEVGSPITESTSTLEKIELTQEELDRIVEEKINEKINEVETVEEPVKKPSFFKRVKDFLFGWMF